MELTIQVKQSTIDAIKKHASEFGNPTEIISEAASEAIELALLNTTKPTAFILKASAVQKLNAYAHLKGTTPNEVAVEVSDTLSEILENVLKERIAIELGITPQVTRSQPRVMVDTTGISDGLGDDDLEPEMPPAESSEMALLPSKGGLTDKDLEDDMEVSDPGTEAKSDAPSFGDDLAKANENLFAEVAGFEQEYVDPRIAKRRKGPTKSKGRVKPLTSNIEAESAEV